MTLARNFRYDEYVRAFRAVCAQRGIDPLQGATESQVVHVLAERRCAARPIDRWWERPDLWQECPPYRGETEEDAIWHLFSAAYILTVQRAMWANRQRRMALKLLEYQLFTAGGK